MTNKEKKQILIFAREAFHRFYDENYLFLSDYMYKPGKKTYRNLLSLNKMMSLYLKTTDDYIVKADAINITGWKGASSYVQHERIITNFDLSDTSWKDRDRAVLLLNDKGIELRNKYQKFQENNPNIDLMELGTLPDFAIKFILDEIRNTTSKNMTLWKNTIITALYLYCELGYIRNYTKSDTPTPKEERALRHCCNYTKEDGTTLMDLTYIQQPIAMLRNLGLLNAERQLTNMGYKLLKDLKMFSEIGTSLNDFKEVLEQDIDEIENVFESKIALIEVDAPERTQRKSKVALSKEGPKNRNFEKLNKENTLTGNIGEKLVLDFERERLRQLSINEVEEKVFLTSSKQEKYGNAYPCDIISYDPATGKEIYIEVKTTRGGIDTPFYISADEVQFSIDYADAYRLYRVFDALKGGEPKVYLTSGKVEDNFLLENERYIASRFKE